MSNFSSDNILPLPDSDFWKPHEIPDPETLGDISIGNPIPSAAALKNIRSTLFGRLIPLRILLCLKKGMVQDVRGNGKCGIYAILVQLFRRFPQLRRLDHQSFMEQLLPIMIKHGVEEDPQDIDASVLFRLMSEYLQTYYSDDIEHPSFAMFSLSDGAVSLVTSSESSSYPANLFVVLHNYRHYKGILLSEADRVNLFHLLLANERS